MPVATTTRLVLSRTITAVATLEPTRAHLIDTDAVYRAHVSLKLSRGEVEGAWIM
jgi:hypothetical protein